MERYRQLKQLVDSGLKDTWIAEYMSIDIKVVQDVQLGGYTPPSPKPKPNRVGLRLVPLTVTFPDLPDDMTDGERIIVLTKHGISAEKIRRYLKSTITASAISAYARRKLGRGSAANNSRDNQISVSFMPYVEYCLELLGKDKFKCELCLDPVPKGAVIHHTKYEGCTVYDLLYICQSCNLARENKGLA